MVVAAAAFVIHLFDRFYFHQTEQFQISYLKSNIATNSFVLSRKYLSKKWKQSVFAILVFFFFFFFNIISFVSILIYPSDFFSRFVFDFL